MPASREGTHVRRIIRAASDRPDRTLRGFILGLAARLGRFCTLGAIEDYLYQQSDTRLRMWGLAIGVAGLSVFAAAGLGGFDISRNVYWITPWSPFASILGGLLFGYGMSLAGTCGFGALARLGGGDLRSFVIVLVMGIAAYVMMSGPLARVRIMATEATTPALDTQGYAQMIERLTGLPMIAAGLVISGGIVLAMLGARGFRSDRRSVIWGALVGNRDHLGLDRHVMGGHAWLRPATGAKPQLRGPARRDDPVSDDGKRRRLRLRGRLGLWRDPRRRPRQRHQGAFPLGGLRRPARTQAPDPRRGLHGVRRGAGLRLHGRDRGFRRFRFCRSARR